MVVAVEALLWQLPLLVLAVVGTYLVMSGSQTLFHYWLGHHRAGGPFFRNHIRNHHAVYARGHLTSAIYQDKEGNNTPYFLIPTVLAGAAAFLVLPLELFFAVALTAAASFYLHVCLDKAYHVHDSVLRRFAWFRRKQQLHFVHHLHANSNYAVIDFFWDRLLGTFRRPDQDV